MNDSMRELQIILLDRVKLLSKQLGEATNAEEAKAILDEMNEFNHRVTLVGGLLFKEQSIELDSKVDEVRRAKSRVDKAIKETEDLINTLTVVSDFLALVDEAIDLAKAVKV